jgi:hypothetical protein
MFFHLTNTGAFDQREFFTSVIPHPDPIANAFDNPWPDVGLSYCAYCWFWPAKCGNVPIGDG